MIGHFWHRPRCPLYAIQYLPYVKKRVWFGPSHLLTYVHIVVPGVCYRNVSSITCRYCNNNNFVDSDNDVLSLLHIEKILGKLFLITPLWFDLLIFVVGIVHNFTTSNNTNTFQVLATQGFIKLIRSVLNVNTTSVSMYARFLHATSLPYLFITHVQLKNKETKIII